MWKIWVNLTQPDPTCNPIDQNMFLIHLNDPFWPVTHLTRPEPPILPCLFKRKLGVQNALDLSISAIRGKKKSLNFWLGHHLHTFDKVKFYLSACTKKNYILHQNLQE